VPEGDSLRRAEALLVPILEGQLATAVWFRMLHGIRPTAGQRIERVVAVGKHLLIEFDRRLTLDTHLGMTGSWKVCAPEVRRAADPRLRVVISTDRGHALCFAAPLIRTFVRDGVRSPVAHLGPDLSDDEADLAEIVGRARLLPPGTPIADALLDQRVASGVGNVFKSEALYVAGVHPFRSLAELDDATLTRLWSVAHEQLLRNRDRKSRSTVGGAGGTFVYGRHHLGCRRCSGPVRYDPSGGRSTRSTYWCPTCQPS
jgi:endonuclease VIII